VAACLISSNDQQGNVGHDIEHYEDNLEQREERVNDHVEDIRETGNHLLCIRKTQSPANIQIMAAKTNQAPFMIVHHMKTL